MSYTLKSLKSLDDFSFDTETKAILDHLNNTWDISAAPKNYDKHSTEPIPESDSYPDFKGHGDSSAGSFHLIPNLSKENVAFSDSDQGRPPLDTLVSAILTHGILLGKRMADLDHYSEANKKLDYVKHCLTHAGFANIPEIKHSFLKEAETYMNKDNLGLLTLDTNKQFEKERLTIIKDKISQKILSLLKETNKPITFTDTSDNPLLKKYYGILYELYVYSRNHDTLKKTLSKMGILIKLHCDENDKLNFTLKLSKATKRTTPK